MRSIRHSTTPSRLSGFALFEVLITLVILLIGLLGYAAFQIRLQQTQIESYQRSQALIILEDVLGRIGANKPSAGCYAKKYGLNGFLGIDSKLTSGSFNCNIGPPAAYQRANDDLAEINLALQGGYEGLAGSSLGLLERARVCINQDAGDENVYVVSVAWQGVISSRAPSATQACGKDAFGGADNEDKRRVLSATVQIAKLKA